MKRMALLVGVNDYVDERINDLECCAHDANETAFTLRRDLGFDEAVALTQSVTTDKVMDQLARIGQRLSPGDLFVFFFAGHGKTQALPGGARDQLFLLPRANADLLSQQALVGATGILSWRALKALTDRWSGVQRLFIFDACRLPLETAALANRGTAVAAAYEGAGVFRDFLLQRQGQQTEGNGAALAVINSCDDGDQAEELPAYPGGGHGKFTAALLEDLQAAARAARGVRADAELAERLHVRMQQLGPAHGGSARAQRPLWVGDAVVLAQAPAPAAAPAPERTPPPHAANDVLRLLADFERQLAAGQIDTPRADSCRTTLVKLQLAGVAEATLDAMAQRLSGAAAVSSAPAPAPKPRTTPTPPTPPASPASPPATPESRRAGLVRPWAAAGLAGLLGLGVWVWVSKEPNTARLLTPTDQRQANSPSPAAPPPSAPPPLPLLDGASAQRMAALQQAAADGIGASVVFRDALNGGSGHGPEMVVIPGGQFTIGSPEQERQGLIAAGFNQELADWEKPRSGVAVPTFAMARHEVTVGDYAAFVKATQRAVPDGCWHWDGAWKNDPKRSWRSPGFEQTDAHPVVCVSWEDARAYAAWLSAQTRQRYRLPSEAEWELAARAGTTTSRWWGDDAAKTKACANANVADRVYAEKLNRSHVFDCRDGHVHTAPVGQFAANPLGLQDVLGNAAEWTEDCFDPSHATMAANGAARANCSESRRVVRGGSWNYHPDFLRSASRNWYAPDYRNDNIGFRLARTF